jgi:hypothetical protein
MVVDPARNLLISQFSPSVFVDKRERFIDKLERPSFPVSRLLQHLVRVIGTPARAIYFFKTGQLASNGVLRSGFR